MSFSAESVSFVGVLVRRCPFLLPVLQEHLEDHDGEVIPHLVMADVERWAERTWIEGDHGLVDDLLAVLEEEYVRPAAPEVENMIVVSFLENLPRVGDRAAELRDRLGPALTEELAGCP